MNFGVAVVYLGDARALKLTIRSFAQLDPQPMRVVVVEHPAGLRPMSRVDGVQADEWIGFKPGGNPRADALRALEGCEIVAVVREGTALAPSAFASERRRFDENPLLQCAMLTSRMCMELDDFLVIGDQTDPFQTLVKKGGLRSERAPLYFAPCVMMFALRRLRSGTFEKFARRSDWASARVFLDSILSPAAVMETASESFGLIANQPDRREAYAQGREACQALFQFSASHERYRRLARSDIQKLVWQQIVGIARRSRARPRISFLRGMFDAIIEEATARRRFARDVSDLA